MFVKQAFLFNYTAIIIVITVHIGVNVLHVSLLTMCPHFIFQEQELCAEAEEKVERLVTKKADLETHIQEMVERLDDEVENNANISAARRKLEAEVDNLKEEQEDMAAQLDNMELEKAQKEKDCQSLEAELDKVTETLARTHKENKTLEERLTVSTRILTLPSLYELVFHQSLNRTNLSIFDFVGSHCQSARWRRQVQPTVQVEDQTRELFSRDPGWTREREES